jgi:ergothioneine biosynthesis protein EgtB
MIAQTQVKSSTEVDSIDHLYQEVRARTLEIVEPLEIEDYVIQTADFMSPPRWHIGHTSWFFETVLQKYQPEYRTYSEEFLFYFNSYYEGFGARIERPRRGARSRPTVRETLHYREYIDEGMSRFIESAGKRDDAETILAIVRLGLEHEMQHQELLVYDIKHLLCDQFDAPMRLAPRPIKGVSGMAEVEGGLSEVGYEGWGSSTVREGVGNYDFAFDNEKPRHKVFLEDFLIDRAPVTNGDYLDFIKAGGYQEFRWWHSAGWEKLNQERWQAPLYWEQHDGEWMIRDFTGLHRVENKLSDPVSHVSFLEASAFAKWAGKRLPTEAEWERAATYLPELHAKHDFPWGNPAPGETDGNLFENGLWSVAPIGSFPDGQSAYGCQQMIGDVWEWTTSDYVPYPGFKSEFDEYNDKWFVGQKVLRGGSFATPRVHIRSTYRNFFYPHERWMIAGFRCAKDK